MCKAIVRHMTDIIRARRVKSNPPSSSCGIELRISSPNTFARNESKLNIASGVRRASLPSDTRRCVNCTNCGRPVSEAALKRLVPEVVRWRLFERRFLSRRRRFLARLSLSLVHKWSQAFASTGFNLKSGRQPGRAERRHCQHKKGKYESNNGSSREPSYVSIRKVCLGHFVRRQLAKVENRAHSNGAQDKLMLCEHRP
ncbi:unnamed protein product [Protopolystoma xenopodis]|uniref:Uncharacterized protein n=1 Tax=Protopolystoma xenopodis TaxID=117903 RepID=A0A3S5B3R0_9PLAT|nr:unnamed protein product [Protopolystoma xenopodis]